MKVSIVYLLTNISKKEGKRFYIGSKQEATLEIFDGVMTILDRKDKPYYSSSTSIEMQEEMKRGDIFEASLLESGVPRKELIFVENRYITDADAVHCEDYYNKSNALMNCHDQGAVANKFGETVKDLACRNSSWSKRDATARKLGFSNFGLLHLWVREKKDEGLTHAAMSKIIGKHRHFSLSLIKGIDLEKAYIEIAGKDEYESKLRCMILAGCSLYYACEVLGIEITSGRVMLGDFNKKHERSFRAASKNSMTKQEMEEEVLKVILMSPDGLGMKAAATKLNISLAAVKRYLSRWLKANVDPATLKGKE